MGQVSLERMERVAIVVLDRPERHNALDGAMLEELERVLDQLEASPGRAVVVTGTGSAFCAGLDLDPAGNPMLVDLRRAVEAGDRDAVARLVDRLRRPVDRLAGLPVPLLAALNGPALGVGAEIALRCDLRLLDPTANLSLNGVHLGLAPLAGGGAALARLLGPSRAADLVVTGRQVSAVEAFSLGLANRLCEPGKALESALGLAVAIASNGPRAVRAALRVARDRERTEGADLLELERDAAVELISSGEPLVGLAAALARRRPDFPDPS